ncbi:hypothetical protein M2271_006497 [Streptomyces sp. LBL]|uniref:hypothetical protein n=1 Tax=Streptomyces sp. LBL TaxID=2940562 RepID=UPI0024767EB7|nr:hypothetical protein [Streptomyces sp. LBL]MDH6628664.1 hypothetical protein [Streptomyces sp. LBL]
MRDGDWYIGYYAYSNYPGALLHFGREDTGIYCLSEPDIAFADVDVADAPLPGEDGVRMGRDYQRSATATFELGVDGSHTLIDRHWPLRPGPKDRVGKWTDMEAALAFVKKDDQSPAVRGLDGVNLLRQVWRADAIRGRAGRVSWLAHKTGGRTRRLYGRPRKFAVSHSRLSSQGYTPVVADFVAVDDRFYDETAQQVELYDHVAVSLPWRPGRGSRPEWLYTSKKTIVFQQKGTMHTYPYIDVYGPCKNPKITMGGLWAVQLDMTIAAGAYVRIDPRPWIRTVTLRSGADSKSVADKLTRASPRLAQMFIPPGLWSASLSYTKTAGATSHDGPRILINWRDAYNWW